MTTPPPGHPAVDDLRHALDVLLPGNARAVPDPHGHVPLDILHAAAARIGQQLSDVERLTPLAGCVIAAMKERGMSWREIYDQMGIVQRTADRWMKSYIRDGLTLDHQAPTVNPEGATP